ncbi:MAG TPA: 2-dehydro-3-deoxyphosphooctonate aldolase [Flavobacterium sp.]|nr:2-dehydro-3-deoxyphosphooctonate aldolase [Flavobacterium sp.]
MNKFSFLLLVLCFSSCVSTKSTIKNIDNEAIKPKIESGSFVFTDYATDKNYGFQPDYPINIGVILEQNEEVYIDYFFNGLSGPNSEKILFKKVDSCCPFPTKNSDMGVGLLSIYEFYFEGSTKKNTLYFNIYEKGKIMCPKGFSIKKLNVR